MPASRPSGPPRARGHRHPVPSAHVGRVVAPRSAELGEWRRTRRFRRGFSENGAVFRVSGCRHPARPARPARGVTGIPSRPLTLGVWSRPAARNSENGAELGGFGADSPRTVPCSELRDAGIPPVRPARSRGATGNPSGPPARAQLPASRSLRQTRRPHPARSSEIGAKLGEFGVDLPRSAPFSEIHPRRTPRHPSCLRPRPGPADAQTPSLPTPETRPGGRRRHVPRGAGNSSPADARVASRARTTAAIRPGGRGEASGERMRRFH